MEICRCKQYDEVVKKMDIFAIGTLHPTILKIMSKQNEKYICYYYTVLIYFNLIVEQRKKRQKFPKIYKMKRIWRMKKKKNPDVKNIKNHYYSHKYRYCIKIRYVRVLYKRNTFNVTEQGHICFIAYVLHMCNI